MKRNREKIEQAKRLRRKIRTRSKIFGTAKRPRLCVTRSLRHVFVQLIDDSRGKTLVSAKDGNLESSNFKKDAGKVDISFELGRLIAKKALEKKIERVVFDKGANKYQGRVKAVAEGAREGGLKF